MNLGGSAFLRNLIELVRQGKVNVQTRIDPEELQYETVIGRGVSGVVWKAIWRNQKVAVKKFNEDNIAFSVEEFNSEMALMSILRHENVVYCTGSCTEPGELFIVSELFEKGSLVNIIEEPDVPLPTSLIIHLALGAAKGMKYLHTLGLIHRDLKNGNLLVTDDWTVKVADFGLSRMMDKTMTRGVGTPIYTAPEVLEGNEYSQKADVYSYAFVLWELFTRSVPFADLPPFEVVRRAVDEGLRPEIPENCILERLIRSCWDKEPDNRPDFNEIVNILSEIQKLINFDNKSAGAEEEDLEDKQYNYAEANQILHRTLRNAESPTDPDAIARKKKLAELREEKRRVRKKTRSRSFKKQDDAVEPEASIDAAETEEVLSNLASTIESEEINSPESKIPALSLPNSITDQRTMVTPGRSRPPNRPPPSAPQPGSRSPHRVPQSILPDPIEPKAPVKPSPPAKPTPPAKPPSPNTTPPTPTPFTPTPTPPPKSPSPTTTPPTPTILPNLTQPQPAATNTSPSPSTVQPTQPTLQQPGTPVMQGMHPGMHPSMHPNMVGHPGMHPSLMNIPSIVNMTQNMTLNITPNMSPNLTRPMSHMPQMSNLTRPGHMNAINPTGTPMSPAGGMNPNMMHMLSGSNLNAFKVNSPSPPQAAPARTFSHYLLSLYLPFTINI